MSDVMRNALQKCYDAVFEIGLDIDEQDEISLRNGYGDGLRCGVEDHGYQENGYFAAEHGFNIARERVSDYFYGEQDAAQDKIIKIAKDLGIEINTKKTK